MAAYASFAAAVLAQMSWLSADQKNELTKTNQSSPSNTDYLLYQRAQSKQIKNAANTGAMTSGAVTVADTSVATNDVILYSRRTLAGTATHGAISAVTGSTSFVITTTGTETSTFDYALINA